MDKGCRQCHGAPGDAPATMVKAYGSSGGFGWKPEEVVGAQIVAVPMEVPIQSANRGTRALMTYLSIAFLAVIALVNLGLYYIVIRPLRRIATVADRISRGEETEPPPIPTSKDEIADVAGSVHRLSVSLNKALQMLG
jgi:protein-histidine pros-kinase